MRNLLIFLAVVCMAQTPTQIDYNTQIRNKPLSYVAVPGINTLTAAVAATPAGGTLVMPAGRYTLTTPVTIGKSLTVQCQPGAVILTGAAGMHADFIVTANQVTITGCTLDGQWSQHAYLSFYGGIYTNNVTEFTATYNTFQNMAGWAVFLDTAISNSYVAHNVYSNIGDGTVDNLGGGGILAHNPDNLRIEYETCNTLTTDNCIHIFAGAISAGSPNGSYSIDHVHVTNFARLGIEASTTRTRWASITNSTIENSAGNTAFSITNVGGGGASSAPEQGLLFQGNFCFQPSTLAAGGYCAELFSNHLEAADNTSVGPWDVGIVFTSGGRIHHNEITGPRLGIAGNGADALIPGSTMLVDHNIIKEFKQVGIGASSENVIVDSNTINRTPGFFPDDATTLSIAVESNSSYMGGGTGQGGLRVTNNAITINPAVTIPVGYGFAGFDQCCSANNGSLYNGNTVWNQNTAQFGQVWLTPNGVYFTGAQMYMNKYIGMKYIGEQAYNASTGVFYYGGNQSYPGVTGVAADTDFTITNFFQADPSKAVVTYFGSCAGAVASGSNTNSFTGLGNAASASCSNGAGGFSDGTNPILSGCTLQNLQVSSRTSGNDSADGVFTVYAGANPTTLTCKTGATSSCSDTTHQPGIGVNNRFWVNVVTDSTSLSNLVVSFQCVPQ